MVVVPQIPLMSHLSCHFEPRRHERELVSIIREIRALDTLDAQTLHRIVRRYPKEGRSAFSKSEIIRGFRFFAEHYGWQDGEASFVEKVRMKPVRTLSGVAPVTVLTRPHPCPGRCIFCPADAGGKANGAGRGAYHDRPARGLGRQA